MNLADHLRELAGRLPAGGSLVLSRDGLLELAAAHDSERDERAVPTDFTIAELAVRFHRAPSTIRGWCEHGCFTGAYKLNGRDWRIPSAAVDAFRGQQRRPPSAVELGAWRAVRKARMMGER